MKLASCVNVINHSQTNQLESSSIVKPYSGGLKSNKIKISLIPIVIICFTHTYNAYNNPAIKSWFQFFYLYVLCSWTSHISSLIIRSANIVFMQLLGDNHNLLPMIDGGAWCNLGILNLEPRPLTFWGNHHLGGPINTWRRLVNNTPAL